HMTEVLSHPEHIPVWDAAARGEPVDWEALFRGYQATVDWPGCNFYRDYLRLYPEARVILTVRDPERWYDSARRTIYYVRQALPPPERRSGVPGADRAWGPDRADHRPRHRGDRGPVPGVGRTQADVVIWAHQGSGMPRRSAARRSAAR